MRTLCLICLIVLGNSCTSFYRISHEDTSTLGETRSTHIYTIWVFDTDKLPLEGATVKYKFVNVNHPSDNIDEEYITDSQGYFRQHFSVHPDPRIKERLEFSSTFAYSISKIGYVTKTGFLQKTVKGGQTFGFLNEDWEEVILLKQLDGN